MSTIHLLSLPHALTRASYSHDANANKVRLFAPMMAAAGYTVVHYGSGERQDNDLPENVEHVSLMPLKQYHGMRGEYDPVSRSYVGGKADTGSALYHAFNFELNKLLMARSGPKDIIALPFGHAHNQAIEGVLGHLVETGIGYPQLGPGRVKIFESYAWMHWHLGHASATHNTQAWGHNDWYVVPNYYDPAEWKPRDSGKGKYVLMMCRMQQDKGLDVMHALARAEPDIEFRLVGQGNPSQWMNLPNITYHAPIHGKQRSGMLRNAIALLCPTQYVEPFGQVAIEAMLCGTPVLASPWGAFSETIDQGLNGQLCRGVDSWRAGLAWAQNGVDRGRIRQLAVTDYSLDTLGRRYTEIFIESCGVAPC